MSDRVEKIAKLDGIETEIDQFDNDKVVVRSDGDKAQFDRLMAEGANAPKQVALIEPSEQTKKVSPMEIANSSNRTSSRIPSMQEIVALNDKAVQQMESVKRKLDTPGLKLSNAEVHHLENKLSHIQEGIKVALGKVGLDYTPPDAPKGLISPIQKFIGYMTHGQHQLESLTTELNSVALMKEQLDPGKMLAIQAKMGFINGELEFFSSALNKVLESLKTIMNVQV